MRKHLTWMLGLAATLAVATSAMAVAAAEQTTVVRAGDLVLTLSGGVTPRTLPGHRLAPIAFHGSGRLATIDGSQPPALKQVVIDADKNAVVDVRGLPVCSAGRLQAEDTAHAKRACPGAILGSGSATVRVAFPEQAPFEATGPLVLFNGGVEGGVTTLFLHAYVDVPAPTAIVTPVKISREHTGRLGNHMVISVPVIAGGSGSVVHAELTARRLFRYRGRQRSFLSARCSGGRFVARGTFEFRDETQISGDLVRPCRATG